MYDLCQVNGQEAITLTQILAKGRRVSNKKKA